MSSPPCNPVKLRYDGKYEFVLGENRQWTIVSDFVDSDGANRKGSSFFLETLKDIGALK